MVQLSLGTGRQKDKLLRQAHPTMPPDHYQMYILRNVTKMDSLKEAVGNFIEETAKINNDIADTEDKHHIIYSQLCC